MVLLKVSTPRLDMAPPVEAFPLVRVSPEMETVLPLPTLKMRLSALPSMVSDPAPGPAMVRFLMMESSPLVAVVVPVSRIVPVTLKTIVSPGAASMIACRREPAPESLVLLTVSVAACAGAMGTVTPNATSAASSPSIKGLQQTARRIDLTPTSMSSLASSSEGLTPRP